MYSLERLAQKLIRQGPCKKETTARRVRGLFNGKYAFDTINAHHVWELELRYPQYAAASLRVSVHTTYSLKVLRPNLQLYNRRQSITGLAYR
jgi:hypothetical protein